MVQYVRVKFSVQIVKSFHSWCHPCPLN